MHASFTLDVRCSFYATYKAAFSEPLIASTIALQGLFYYLAVPLAGELQALSFVMSPQAAATSVVKGGERADL